MGRSATVVGLIALAAFSSGQSGSPGINTNPLPPEKGGARSQTENRLGRPQAMIQIRGDRFGSQIVSVTMLDPSYPPDQLQSQILKLGEILGEKVRGLQVFRYSLGDGDQSAFVKATFGVDRLVAPEGDVRILPLAKALSGAPEPSTIRGFGVVIEGFAPGAKTVKSAETDAYRIVGQLSGSTLEYRVELKSQDPSKFELPGSDPSSKQRTPSRQPIDWGLWLPIAFTAVAAGTLVYAAFAWPRARR